MTRALGWAGAGALCGLVLGVFFAGDAARVALERADGAALDLLANRLRGWVTACTALGLAAGLLTGAVRERSGGAAPPRRRLAGSGLALAGVLAWAAAGVVVWRAPSHGDTPPERPVAEGPNLALVVLDTTRRDRLSVYGYGRPTTPRLEQLAESSTVYERAWSTSSWTCPSHASLFTGRLPLGPGGHGVTQAAWDLPAEQLTLAERLREHGYRTAGIAGNPMVGRALGFDQGFDEYHETWRENAVDGRHPALAHLEALLDADDPRPFFAFLNFIEPHSPYTSLGPEAAEFAPFIGTELDGPTQNHWRAYYLGRKRFTPEELGRLGDRYDAELRTTDTLVGEVVDALASRGVLDRTVLVVTSDHGENLGEHGMLDHVFSLYEETVAVPLIVRYPPAFAAERVSRPVQLVDVHATLAALAGLAPEGGPGVDLRDADGPERPVVLCYDYPSQALRAMGADAGDPALDRYRRRLFALVEGSLKVIAADDGALELYDLEADPREQRDLAGGGDARFDALVEQARAWLAEPPVRDAADAAGDPGQAVDAETLRELRDLGYAE